MEEQLNITRTLSAYIAQVDAARLPQPVVEKAKIHILDSIGAIINRG